MALIGDQPVELVDPFWLFAQGQGDARGGDTAPLCLIDGDDSWMRGFVAPMLAQAGYRVTHALAPGERADAVLTLDTGADAAAVRLRSMPGGPADTVYRYDRGGIIAAIETRIAGARA